jgi:glycosyltransferase involved in cell wall biosynthesis
MEKRKKLLYITDQQEYTDHGTIGPMFNGYLKDECDVYVVYFTKYKNSFQKKGTDYVIPEQYKKEICRYMDVKEVNLASFDFVFVRNMSDVLSDVLKNKDKYGYKVGFRVSFPKTEEACEARKANHSNNIFGTISSYFKKSKMKSLISQCDLFMPTSKDMEETFYANNGVKSFPLPAGLDPARITPHRESDGSERHFIYVGTLDSLRQFEQILVAFTKLKSDNWHLNITTLNPEFARTVMGRYSTISNKVSILQADNLNILMKQVDDCDVGIALLPDIPVYSTTVPAKIMDYYTCAIPALLTDNSKNRSLFSDDDALFCQFDEELIVKKLEEIIAMSQEDIAKMGHNGQDKLLSHKRNYKIMAKKLYAELESL